MVSNFHEACQSQTNLKCPSICYFPNTGWSGLPNFLTPLVPHQLHHSLRTWVLGIPIFVELLMVQKHVESLVSDHLKEWRSCEEQLAKGMETEMLYLTPPIYLYQKSWGPLAAKGAEWPIKLEGLEGFEVKLEVGLGSSWSSFNLGSLIDPIPASETSLRITLPLMMMALYIEMKCIGRMPLVTRFTPMPMPYFSASKVRIFNSDPSKHGERSWEC